MIEDKASLIKPTKDVKCILLARHHSQTKPIWILAIFHLLFCYSYQLLCQLIKIVHVNVLAGISRRMSFLGLFSFFINIKQSFFLFRIKIM